MSQRSFSRDSLNRLSSNTFSSASKMRRFGATQSQKQQRTLGVRSNSQPEIPTVKDFVKFVTKTDQEWGISGYKVARCNAAIQSQIKWSFPKEKDKKFIHMIEKRAKFGPAPNKYEKPNRWKEAILGSMKGENKTTFIAKIFKTEGSKPSPCQYQIIDNRVALSKTLGKVNKGDRMSTVCNAEYLASVTPGAKYVDIYTKIKRGTSMPDLKKGLTWKVKKKDGPDPGSYPLKEKALATLVSQVSPSWKQGKGERRFFTTAISKRKEWVPGAGKYDTIDYSKVHRRLTSKRH